MGFKEESFIEMFSYDAQERRIFPFIDDYMKAVEGWLVDHSFDDAQLLRYMIAGVFLEFQATVHHGDEFNTTISEWTDLKSRPKTSEKLKNLNQRFGKEIRSASEYLKLIGAGKMKEVNGAFLRNYVIHGKRGNQS
jgi:hypothetical protein